MIIKKIHYCWFGGKPLPESAKNCIHSWKKFMPGYEIIQWDESNFDVKKTKFMADAFNAKKYAFVSDNARFEILHKYGGIFLDIDVEIIRDLNPIIKKGPFMGLEEGSIDNLIKKSNGKKTKENSYIAPGLCIYAKPRMPIIKDILTIYENKSFKESSGKLNLTPSPSIVTDLILKKKIVKKNNYAFVEGMIIYPAEYFNPLGKNKYLGFLNISKNTYSIHHYNASWKSKKENEWISKMKFKKTKMGDIKFNKYINKITTKISKSIYINGFIGFLKNQFRKIRK